GCHRHRPGHELCRVRRPRHHRLRVNAAPRPAGGRRRRRAALLCRPPHVLVRAAPRRAADRVRFPLRGFAMTIDTDVCVIGAGPAGLTTAYCLTRQARPVVVVEKDPVYVGGISRTVNYNGFSFDIGGHRFFSKAKEVVDLWHEILPDDFIERPRLSRIYYDGKFYSYPLKAFE